MGYTRKIVRLSIIHIIFGVCFSLLVVFICSNVVLTPEKALPSSATNLLSAADLYNLDRNGVQWFERVSFIGVREVVVYVNDVRNVQSLRYGRILEVPSWVRVPLKIGYGKTVGYGWPFVMATTSQSVSFDNGRMEWFGEPVIIDMKLWRVFLVINFLYYSMTANVAFWSLVSLLVSAVYSVRVRRRRAYRKLCMYCGYSVASVVMGGVCPECGRVASKS